MDKIDSKQVTIGKYNTEISGNVQGFVQGEHVNVTMNFDSTQRTTSKNDENLSTCANDFW